MSEYHSSELHTADAQTWTFNVTELDWFELDAPNVAKSAVSEATGINYKNLRARLVNQGGLTDTYVTVVQVKE